MSEFGGFFLAIQSNSGWLVIYGRPQMQLPELQEFMAQANQINLPFSALFLAKRRISLVIFLRLYGIVVKRGGIYVVFY